MTGTDPALDARALELLDAALDQPSETRAAWVRARCGADTALAERTLRLLSAGDAARLRTGSAARDAGDAAIPERIGAYRITGLIGAGGMGAVYRGERATGDFDHVVAIKLIRPGALSDALVARFARERQTLARLVHPNIARLLDGGETPAGEPYFVMEFVEGVPLGAWLASGPDRATRARVFLSVCDAVGFAHQNLIVHRDLTPSNILVRADGTPVLIDFGIARPPATGDADAAPSRATLDGLTMTPGFAAPERLAGAPATTLSDIYSLGQLLDRMLGEGADADLASIIARARHVDPAARYPSAGALADDVRAWVGGRAVAARRGGRRYALGKFVARNRLAVGASLAALLIILGALAATSWSYARAERARAAEARRFADLRALAGYLLFDLNDRLARIPGNTTARASLAGEAQRYLSGLAATPGGDRALGLETARGLAALARIQGVGGQPSLGDAKLAKANLATASRQLDTVEARFGAAPDIAALRAHVLADRSLIAVLSDKDKAAAQAFATDALRTLDAVPAGGRDDEWHLARRAGRRAALEYANQQSDAKAMTALAARLDADRAEWPAALQAGPEAAFDRALADYYRGVARLYDTTGDRGLALLARAYAGFAALEARRPGDAAVLYMMAWSAMDGFGAAAQTGDDPAAARLVRLARDAVERLSVREDRDDTVRALSHSINEAWAQHLADTKRFPEAIAAQREVVRREAARIAAERARGNSPLGVDLAFSEMILGVTGRKAGDRNLACDSWRSAATRFASVQARGKLSEFHAAFLPGLQRNLALCAAGVPAAQFRPLR